MPPSTPPRKKRAPGVRSPRRSPRLRTLKRTEIWATSWRMKKQKADCTWQDVFQALFKADPHHWTQHDRPKVQRWSFSETTDNKNRGTPAKSPELRVEILKRLRDPSVPDSEKTTRNMAAYFTAKGTPVANNFVHKVYVEEDLYPARPTKELDLTQHHHRRLRIHFAKLHRRMTAEDWEAWVSTDETILRMRRTINPKNDVKWVKKGTFRPNPKPTAKHVPTLYAWGAVGGKGQKSQLHIFAITMTSAYYKDVILKKYGLPFFRKIKKDYPSAVFWQDNDPKHTPNEAWVRAKFSSFTAKPPAPCRHNIQYTGKRGRPKSDPCEVCRCKMPDYEYHSANSADIPPIENIWSLLQDKIWRDPNTRITSLIELQKAAQRAWKAITPAEVLNIQHSMPQRMKAVIESEGWPINY